MRGTAVTHSGMGQAARSLLIGRQDRRPDPQYMASLIMRGLNEEILQDVWQESGQKLPRMQATLTETDTLIPFIQRASDTLAAGHSKELKLFAARDADCLYDDYAIVHADDRNKVRLPASYGLWDSRAWANKGLAQLFLSRHGLSREVVVSTDQLVTVVDTGFFGRVGKRLDEKVRKTYDYSLIDARRLNVQLISAEVGAFGTEIMEISGEDLPREREMLPRASQEANSYVYHREEPDFVVARAIELMPRYEGAFLDITSKNGHPLAITGREPVSQNVDHPKRGTDSIVNRLAAAIVQFRIVRAALERIPRSRRVAFR